MAEGIISRRSKSDGKTSGQLVTELIISNTNWTVPNHKGNISVRIFGAGGGGDASGGGGGWMNNGEFNLNTGLNINIVIGQGGLRTGGSGGTTTFGTYLSANGGSWGYMSGGDGGSGGGVGRSGGSSVRGGTGYQFGGGGGGTYGGNGGIWGGGGSSSTYYRDYYIDGCGCGGIYGGGAGCTISNVNHNTPSALSIVGRGGTYGGNGAIIFKSNIVRQAENGTNTIGDNNAPSECQGPGLKGIDVVPGDTGYYTPSGGGGYGGCGGSNYGGGGGYGGNGGNNGGGGGGYGKGADGGTMSGRYQDGTLTYESGGGGYFSKGRIGGGGYGDGAGTHSAAGPGGGGYDQYPGGQGICIIQYYI